MANYIPDPEQLMECPYEKSHRVAAKRFQNHLMKCRMNFIGKEVATCPFNARHEMPKPELRYHIAYCPDKDMLEPILSYEQSMNQEDGKNVKGCTDLPKYEDLSRSSRSAENWDEGGAEMNPKIPQAAGRAQKMTAVGRGVSTAMPPASEVNGMASNSYVQTMNRASEVNGMASNSYVQTMNGASEVNDVMSNIYVQTMNGTSEVYGVMSNIYVQTMNGTSEIHSIRNYREHAKTVPPGFNRQFADFDDREEVLSKLVGGNKKNESPPATARAPAGIGRGEELLPPSAFSVGLGRGVLRDIGGPSPAFVVPSDTGEISNDPPVQEGSNNANFEDAKKKEMRKIGKKLKQIELLEEKHDQGYSYNKDEELKVKSKDKLIKALEELRL